MKKILALLLAVLMMTTMLTGCITQFANPKDTGSDAPAADAPAAGTPAADAPAADAPADAPAAEVPAGPVELEVWYAISGNSGENFLAQSTTYDEGNDNVTLNMTYSGGSNDTATKVSAAILTDTAPDVALMYAGPLYTGGEGNFEMTTLIEDEAFNKADIFEGMLDYCTFGDGGVCAVPYGISTQVMYYNKAILEAAGVDMTNPPKTWDEFYTVLQAVMDKGNINGNDEFTAFDTSDEAWLFKSMLMQNGCQIIESADGEITPIYNNAEALAVANYWKSLIDAGFMAPSEHDNAENKFLAGNLGFIAASSNRISRWDGATEFEIGAIEMPYFTQPSLALGGNVLVILTKDPAKVQAAWEYICYLTGVEQNTPFALTTGYLPIHKSALEQQAVIDAIAGNEMYGVAFNQLQYTWAYTHFSQMGTMDIEIRSMLNKLEKGRGEAQELLDKAVANLQDEIDQG